MAQLRSSTVHRRWKGVHILAKRSGSTDEMIAGAVRAALAYGHVQPGDLVVITAGTSGEVTPTPTDLMKAHRIEHTEIPVLIEARKEKSHEQENRA